ncbi:MAG: carbon-nitrogen hydrolase family protein [Gemmatimonadaceae bacterium]|nr:carbon-nitrogen hydrolase family protein [Gemmatimonadaceae bacterium]
MAPDSLTIAAAQIAPVWLDRERTIEKVCTSVVEAAQAGAQVVAFGECLIPGYPFWLERTDGARFESAAQKAWHAHYLDQAVQLEAGHLDRVRQVAADMRCTVVTGCYERPRDRGGHSGYASAVVLTADGTIAPPHRKLVPTYEERLAWAPGDGHGLRTHAVGAFSLGVLNCWENWMPLPRAALYAMGEDLHVALWPGSTRNTADITRFTAREGRSYVLAASAIMRAADIPDGLPDVETLRRTADPVMANGGSCIASPDGTWVVEPVADVETLVLATISHARVREERQNFDPAGHYSRPDVTRLVLNTARQSTLEIAPD